jgi:hypothetical protein
MRRWNLAQFVQPRISPSTSTTRANRARLFLRPDIINLCYAPVSQVSRSSIRSFLTVTFQTSRAAEAERNVLSAARRGRRTHLSETSRRRTTRCPRFPPQVFPFPGRVAGAGAFLRFNITALRESVAPDETIPRRRNMDNSTGDHRHNQALWAAGRYLAGAARGHPLHTRRNR